MKNRYIYFNLIILILGLLGVGSILYIWLGDESLVKYITKEDGIVENLSAIFYLLSVIICLYRVFKKSHSYRILLLVWAFLCFIFLGEETSWFQRIFHYNVPDFISEHSAQGEVNIHNLNIFQGGHWIKAFSSKDFNMKMFLSSQNLFRLGFFVYFLFMPVLVYLGKIKYLVNKKLYIPPNRTFIVVVWFTLLMSFVIAAYSSVTVKESVAEFREMLYALFIMFYVFIYIRRVPEK